MDLFGQFEEISASVISAGGRAVVQALYFCSQKVWNGPRFTLTGVEYVVSSKQSPTSCLHVARVFSLKLEVWCTWLCRVSSIILINIYLSMVYIWYRPCPNTRRCWNSRPHSQVCETNYHAWIVEHIYKSSLIWFIPWHVEGRGGEKLQSQSACNT